MNESNAFASLSPSLLARKGGARPAMRPQLQTLQQFQEATACDIDDDLGWNDMGADVDPPAPESAEIVKLNPTVGTAPAVAPEVVRQQEVVAKIFAGSAKAAQPRRSARSDGRRVAMTIRLDPDRHLKLRLACMITHSSAQQLLIDALDRLMATSPEVSELASQLSNEGEARLEGRHS